MMPLNLLIITVLFLNCCKIIKVNCEEKYRSIEAAELKSNLLEITKGSSNVFHKNFDLTESEPKDNDPANSSAYDFIIVGAGSAGSVLASRLSEESKYRVLLIEAGRVENLIMDVPFIAGTLQSYDINWKYKTEPSDKYCLGMTNKQCSWPRGKVMGGSSVLNYMVATRGNKKDYDRWAELGNEGWSYEEVLPYFKKLEFFDEPQALNNSYYGDSTGKLYTSYVKYQTQLAKSFINAGQELGYSSVDYDARNQIGFSRVKTTIKNGFRFSNSRAYLHPAKDRENLFVTKNSLASKVLIDPETKKAHGIEFFKNDQKITVLATDEVILSAGAIGSPQLLMLSGVGPEQHLKSVGISPIKNLPVGENLMDHVGFLGLFFTVNVSLSVSDTEESIEQYSFNQTGPYTIPGGTEALAFLNLEGSDSSEIEFAFLPGSFLTGRSSLQHTLGIADWVWEKTYKKNLGKQSFTLYPILLKPKSRGVLFLRDSNINSKPILIPNYFNEPEDIKNLIKGVRQAIKIGLSESMKKYGSQLYTEPVAGCESHVYDSDEYWECALRSLSSTIYHHSGTCKMGLHGDPTAVVNSQLQVHGVKNLRVVDGSIMPEIISGHINVPVTMIAEKAADMIKEYHVKNRNQLQYYLYLFIKTVKKLIN